MSLSTGVRLLAGIATLSITARSLGPESFGLLMFWLSAAGLLCVLNNFGLGVFLLREIGKNPNNAATLLGVSLTAKLILTSVVLAIAAIGVPFLSETSRGISLLLLFTMVIEGFTEFFCTGFRASGRFDLEVPKFRNLGLLRAMLSARPKAWISNALGTYKRAKGEVA